VDLDFLVKRDEPGLAVVDFEHGHLVE